MCVVRARFGRGEERLLLHRWMVELALMVLVGGGAPIDSAAGGKRRGKWLRVTEGHSNKG